MEAPVGWLTLAWKFLRSVPREIWLVLAFAAAIAFAIGYHNHKVRQAHKTGYVEGVVRIQSAWDSAVQHGKALIAEKDRRNAAAQAKAFADGQAIGESRVRDQKDIIASKDRLIADLGNGNRRLHDRWQACLSGPQAGDAAEVPGGPLRADELRREIAEQISEADDADSKVFGLIKFQDVLRKQCEAIAGP